MNRWVGAAIVALAIAAATGTLLLDPTSRMVGEPGPGRVDLFGTQWVYAWVGEVLAGRSGFPSTDLVFYPYGKDLYAHTGGNVLDAVAAWPLRRLFGPVAGYAAWILVLLVTNAWGATRLAGAFGVGPSWRWLAGLAITALPYVRVELAQGRPTQAWLLFPALFMADWWASIEGEGGRRRAALAGLWLALSAFQYWYYGIVLAGVAVVHGLLRPGRLGAAAISAAVAAALALPAAAPMLGHLGEGRVQGLMQLGDDGPAAPIVLQTTEGDPLPLQALGLDGQAGELSVVGGAFARRPVRLQIGAAFFLVGALGLLLLRPRASLWAALPLLVALGPAWGWGDRILVDSWPWSALFASTSVLRRWWFPIRALAPAALVLAAGMAVAVEEVARRSPRGGLALLAALGLLTLREGRAAGVPATLPTIPIASTPVLDCLRDAPAGAVLTVPPRMDQADLLAQVFHRHPISEGMPASRPALQPAGTRALFDLPWVRHFRSSQPGPPPPTGKDEVVALGFRYLLLDRTAKRTADPRLPVRASLGREVAADERYALWTLDGATLRCP